MLSRWCSVVVYEYGGGKDRREEERAEREEKNSRRGEQQGSSCVSALEALAPLLTAGVNSFQTVGGSEGLEPGCAAASGTEQRVLRVPGHRAGWHRAAHSVGVNNAVFWDALCNPGAHWPCGTLLGLSAWL